MVRRGACRSCSLTGAFHVELCLCLSSLLCCVVGGSCVRPQSASWSVVPASEVGSARQCTMPGGRGGPRRSSHWSVPVHGQRQAAMNGGGASAASQTKGAGDPSIARGRESPSRKSEGEDPGPGGSRGVRRRRSERRRRVFIQEKSPSAGRRE